MGEAVYEGNINKYLLQECTEHFQNQNLEGLNEVFKICYCIYGSKDEKFTENLEKIKDNLKVFWDYQIEEIEEKKRYCINSIEQTGREALHLEKALGFSSGFNSVDHDIPLVELEERMWKLLMSYQELKVKRLEEYSMLQKRENELCSILKEKPQIRVLSVVKASPSNRVVPSDLPSCDEMMTCEKRIKDLEEMRNHLEYDFESYKEELKTLLNDCGIIPFSKLERFSCMEDNDGIMFSVTRENLEKLKQKTHSYRKIKESMIAEVIEYREKITTISKRMLKDPKKLETFLNQNSGYSKLHLDALKARLATLKEERQSKLKDLILSQRKILDELWTRCCYSDNQRAKFQPDQLDYFSEEVLTLLELEVEQLEHFYDENKRIFQLTEIHRDLWTRLLHLEDEASHINRLFNNRGGKLLKEEKERKIVQKKIPAIKTELFHLLNEFKATTGKDFLYFGTPLLESLQQVEYQQETAKENRKQIRKEANVIESKLGARPVVGMKRLMQTPQQPQSGSKVYKIGTSATSSTTSVASSKSSASSSYGYRGAGGQGFGYAVYHTPVKTPAVSTPDNGTY